MGSELEHVDVVDVPPELQERLNAKKMLARAHAVKMCYTDVMKEGLHFGKIPGCGPKPTLLKPGAEKLLNVFQYAPQIITEDLSGPDEMRYRVRVRVTHILTGLFVGEGVGECSSNEQKYKWRKVVHGKEYDVTEVDRRRLKIDKYGKENRQVRTEPADIANTVLKMAKKRAMVDAALTCTGASDMFEQDLDDMPEMDVEPRQEPKAKAAPPTTTTEPPKEGAGYGSPGQIKRIFAIAKANNWEQDDIKKLMLDKFGWTSTSQIDCKKNYDWLCEHIEQQTPGDFDPEPKMDVDENGIPF